MVQQEMVCAGCTAAKCCDAPSPATPLVIECPGCYGGGCGDCGGSGEWQVTGCPRDLLSVADYEALALAAMWKKGLPPVAGGVLDQSAWFVKAARRIWAEEAHCETHRADELRQQMEASRRRG